jgi:hypothetical protein
MIITKGRMLLAAACCLILISAAGCAGLSSISAKQESLEERVKNYMQAQIDRRWDHAYEFFDSSSRKMIARESYVYRGRTLSYTGFTIEEIRILPSGDQATVKVGIDIKAMTFSFKGVSQTQHWTKERGEWFVKSEPRRNPFITQDTQQ